ncbi:MAG: 50S ribosomal protein L24, partial [Atribacteria sp.]|nr:50S ribosomal protein L24 [Candidatus Atribacteria bacterium]
MINNKIGFRKGDKVLIIIGEDKGKKGKIVRI